MIIQYNRTKLESMIKKGTLTKVGVSKRGQKLINDDICKTVLFILIL